MQASRKVLKEAETHLSKSLAMARGRALRPMALLIFCGSISRDIFTFRGSGTLLTHEFCSVDAEVFAPVKGLINNQ